MGVVALYAAVLHDLLIHFLVDLADQPLQTHDPAFSGLKRLAVLTVHGSEPYERKLCVLRHQMSLLGAAEYLDKMKLLTLVHYIDDLVWMIVLLTLYNGSQICSGIKRRAVGFQDHTGRDFLCVAFFLHIYNQGSLVHISVTFLFQIIHQLRNIRICVGFAFPQVKIHIKLCVILLQVCDRYLHDLIP